MMDINTQNNNNDNNDDNNDYIIYNLSKIPNFNEILYNQPIKEENKKYINKLNKVEYKINENIFYIIRYDKTILNYDLISNFGLCRSVVVNSNSNSNNYNNYKNEIIGFSPPKSIASDLFIKKYPIIDENILVEEFVEGIMLNLFWINITENIGFWEISTRNYLGTYCLNVKELFMETITELNVNINVILNNKYCYSLILQHPKNKLISVIKEPKLYLIGIYKIINNREDIQVISYNIYNFTKTYSSLNYPLLYDKKNYSELLEKYASMNTNYNIMGFVLYNKLTGERTKVYNPVYEQTKNLLLEYNPYTLYETLIEINEKKREINSLYNLFSETLYNNYINCYIKKNHHLDYYSEQFKKHLLNLHKIYIKELINKKKYITKEIVKNYINKLEPIELMYSLNYNIRKRLLDYRKL